MSRIKQDTAKITKIAWALMTATVKNKLDVPAEYIWNIPTNNEFHEIRSKTYSVFSSGNCIKDSEAIKTIESVNPSKYLRDPWITKTFEEYFPVWLRGCSRFKFQGLDDFKHGCFAQGSQEYFLNYYIMNRHKRFRVFKGEYWWHMEVWKKLGLNWAYIEDGDLDSNDVVILSFPFARLGDKHPEQENLLDMCDKIGVPVMLDFIYLPNSTYDSIDIDLRRSCITSLSFSLSKAFPIATARVAIRFTREKVNDPMQISNDENVSNRVAAGYGYEMMKKLPVDFMVRKYKKEQEHWCHTLGLTPTKVVHFALGEPYTDIGRMNQKRFFSEFNDQENRYNLGPLFANKNLLTNLGYYD